MSDPSALQPSDEQHLLRTALEHPFEPADVPLSPSTTSASLSPPPSLAALALLPESSPSESPPAEEGAWQAAYSSQVSEWRTQSADARNKAELARAKWETIRAREKAEREALGQPSESWDGLGNHITTSVAAATHVVSHSLSASVASLSSVEHVEHEHVTPHERSEESVDHVAQGKTDDLPSQPWEHISASPTSSYPSMSFPEASVPQSPSHQHAVLPPTSASPQAYPQTRADHNPPNVAPSTLPSIMDNRVVPRTRLSLALSSLAINLLLPFINGIMLGFGEIFAKDVVVGWFGWKTRWGSTAAGVGLRR